VAPSHILLASEGKIWTVPPATSWPKIKALLQKPELNFSFTSNRSSETRIGFIQCFSFFFVRSWDNTWHHRRRSYADLFHADPSDLVVRLGMLDLLG
jgi:hypothetical protein